MSPPPIFTDNAFYFLVTCFICLYAIAAFLIVMIETGDKMQKLINILLQPVAKATSTLNHFIKKTYYILFMSNLKPITSLNELTKLNLLTKPTFEDLAIGDEIVVIAKVVSIGDNQKMDGVNDIILQLEKEGTNNLTKSQVNFKSLKVLSKVNKVNIMQAFIKWASKKWNIEDEDELDEKIAQLGGKEKLLAMYNEMQLKQAFNQITNEQQALPIPTTVINSD